MKKQPQWKIVAGVLERYGEMTYDELIRHLKRDYSRRWKNFSGSYMRTLIGSLISQHKDVFKTSKKKGFCTTIHLTNSFRNPKRFQQLKSKKKRNMNNTDKRTKPKFITGDALKNLRKMSDNSVHLVLTDPPYFIDKLDDGWNNDSIKASKQEGSAVGGKLPDGMKFDPQQGINLQAFIEPIAMELMRVLKPGGFCIMFSSGRLYHRMAIACENTGFEIRDCIAWRYTKRAQAKAFSQDHFVRKRKDLTKKKQDEIIDKLGGRKTPQLRPNFEPAVLAQKPKEGTFVENWLKHETGLIDVNQGIDSASPCTVITIEKEDRDPDNEHVTPKPVELCKHLIRVFSKKNQLVLDPFVGSGTTCLAAYETFRESIGIDISSEHISTCRKRLKKVNKGD